MRVVIANLGEPVRRTMDFRAAWAAHRMPPKPSRLSLFEQPHDWGFHVYAIGVYLMDLGLADAVEFWDTAETSGARYLKNGVLRVQFLNDDDARAYLEVSGEPDLFINYGGGGRRLLRSLEGRCFRVHVPCFRQREDGAANRDAECYLVDAEEYLDDRSMLYVPVVNTARIRPLPRIPKRDFVYLASVYPGKRHDLLLDAVRGTALRGHLHPVDDPSRLDLADTRVTTSRLDEIDVVELLATSRIAVYPGDRTSNPAAMWECVAAGLPIVVNAEIAGGRHVVVRGVTGELARPDRFRDTMERVLENRDRYRAREYFERHWDTVSVLEGYLAFFERMGWERPRCS